jgi:hypothetical protein
MQNKQEKEQDIPSQLRSFFAAVCLMVPSSLFSAWAMHQMYVWFIMPYGLPNYSVSQFWGWALVISVVMGLYGKTDPDAKARTASQMIGMFIARVIAILMVMAIAFFVK